jgi:hypothetical protein
MSVKTDLRHDRPRAGRKLRARHHRLQSSCSAESTGGVVIMPPVRRSPHQAAHLTRSPTSSTKPKRPIDRGSVHSEARSYVLDRGVTVHADIGELSGRLASRPLYGSFQDLIVFC